VKVAHHGSADQDPALYERVLAAVGLISVGAHNRYGHPTDRLLKILATVGTRAERTDRQGMVLVSPRPGGGMSVWSERSGSEGTGLDGAGLEGTGSKGSGSAADGGAE
jgi:competence protein ComEC